ncbi:hypothetical protein T45_09120 [Streptomyces turgidiscabies]|nr:hypothetical protein T45_09120 [Streptomyces turgidiscabies]
MAGQRARRRGVDAALAQREQHHVLDEGVRVGQGDRHDGRRRCQESGHRSPYGRAAARRDGDQDETDGEKGPGGPLQGRRGARRQPGRDPGSPAGAAPACQREPQAHQPDHRQVHPADGERQRHGREGEQQGRSTGRAAPSRPIGRTGPVGRTGPPGRTGPGRGVQAGDEGRAEPQPGLRERGQRGVAQEGVRESEDGHAGQVRVVVVHGHGVGHVRAARVQQQGARVFDDPDLGLGRAEHDQQGQGEQHRADGGHAQCCPALPGAWGTGGQYRRRAVSEGRAEAPHAVRGQGRGQRQAEGEDGAGQEMDGVPADRASGEKPGGTPTRTPLRGLGRGLGEVPAGRRGHRGGGRAGHGRAPAGCG